MAMARAPTTMVAAHAKCLIIAGKHVVVFKPKVRTSVWPHVALGSLARLRIVLKTVVIPRRVRVICRMVSVRARKEPQDLLVSSSTARVPIRVAISVVMVVSATVRTVSASAVKDILG